MTSSVSGYCSECERLIKLEPRGTHPGSRAQRWMPTKHPAKDDDTGGRDCPGMLRAL